MGNEKMQISSQPGLIGQTGLMKGRGVKAPGQHAGQFAVLPDGIVPKLINWL